MPNDSDGYIPLGVIHTFFPRKPTASYLRSCVSSVRALSFGAFPSQTLGVGGVVPLGTTPLRYDTYINSCRARGRTHVVRYISGPVRRFIARSIHRIHCPSRHLCSEWPHRASPSVLRLKQGIGRGPATPSSLKCDCPFFGPGIH